MSAAIIHILNENSYNYICFQKSQEALEVIIDILKRLIDYDDPEFDHYRGYVDTLEFKGSGCELEDQIKAGKIPPRRKVEDLSDYDYQISTDNMRVNVIFGQAKIFFIGTFEDRERITPVLKRCTFVK